MSVLLFDYGTGNLHSLRKALERQGARVRIGAELDDADALVLPGVGAFGAAAARLAPWADGIRAAAADGLPVLGICLGMQLLLDGSEEGPGEGLGLIPGQVRRLQARRVPHMGWNEVRPVGPDAAAATGTGGGGDPLFGDDDGARFYFANSFAADPADPADVAAWTEHEGVRFPAALRRGSVVGTQFHPEKSDRAGLALLRRFLTGAADAADRRRAAGDPRRRS